jgi:glutamate:GABA antiporter
MMDEPKYIHSEETVESLLPASLEASDRIHPPRVMGFADLLMFYIVTGVSLRWIATAASAGPSSIVIWIGAWLCFYMPLALSVIELSSRYPQEGGLYVWSKRAFGDFSGYMSGWTYWTSNLPYFPAVLYFAASNLLFVRGSHGGELSAGRAYYMWFSILALLLITFLNVIGMNYGKWLHNIGAFGMWLPVVIVVVMGIYAWRHYGSATSFTLASFVPSTHQKDIFFWATLTFAFGGCEAGSFIAGEIKDSRRTIPRALLAAGFLVAFSYIAGTVCVLLAMPSHEVNDLQGLMQAISRTAGRLGWFSVIPFAAVLIAISNIGASGGYLSSVARLPFAAGLDRFLPASFAKLHPRWGTPYVSLLVQMLAGILFVFLAQAGTSVKGAYDVLVSMGIITYFIPYLYLFAAMFWLQREKAGSEVIRVPGGPVIARAVSCVGFVTTLLTIIVSLIPAPDEPNKLLAVGKIVGSTSVLLVLGWLLYYFGKRRRTALARTYAEGRRD